MVIASAAVGVIEAVVSVPIRASLTNACQVPAAALYQNTHSIYVSSAIFPHATLVEAPALPDRPVPIRFRKNVPTAWLRLVLREGRNRQVRRMTAAIGHPTLRLVRVAVGPITLDGLEPGRWRDLTPEEVAALPRAGGSGWLGRNVPGP